MMRFPSKVLFLLVVLMLGSSASAQVPVLVLKHVNVVNVETGAIQRDTTVTITGQRISDIQPARKLGSSGVTQELDATGKFLIPGLWDMHAHFQDPQREMKMYIANGVLGVRNMGGVAKEVFALREKIARGEVLGPRIIACGPIVDGPNPANPSISVSVKDADSGRMMVHTLKDMGADCIKVHDGVPLDAYLALAAEAKKVKLPLVGHIPVAVPTAEASNSGQKSIEHVIGLRGASTAEAEVLKDERENNIFAEAMRTKTFSMIPESIAKRGNRILDTFSQEKANKLYGAFVRNGTYVDPTLVTDHALTYVDELTKEDDPRLKYITTEMRQWWKPENGMLTRYRTPSYIAFRKRQFAKTLQQIPVAQKQHVIFLAGTDAYVPYTYPGFSTHDEMSLFVKAGLSPLQALQTATLNPAKFFGTEKEMGTVATGKNADLVLLDGDPTKDITNTKKIFAVVLRGRLMQKSELDEMLKAAEVK